MNDRQSNINTIIFLIPIIVCSCVTQVYSDEKMNIDPAFLDLFRAMTKSDTIVFSDALGHKKTFIFGEKDSIVKNSKGWFINEKPYKLLRVNFREIGKDTVPLVRQNEIFVNKDPGSNTSSLCIQFDDFYLHTDSVLPTKVLDTISINGRKISNYYLFETAAPLGEFMGINVLYVDESLGILGFKTIAR